MLRKQGGKICRAEALLPRGVTAPVSARSQIIQMCQTLNSIKAHGTTLA
jgi:hypothetical protein